MTKTIKPAPLCGTIAAIPSKSHLHRLLIYAALADVPTKILCGKTDAIDIKATIGCLEALGAVITQEDDGYTVQPLDRDVLPQTAILPVHESGSTLRFMLPVVAALGVKGEFRMAGRLPERPLYPLDREMERHGIKLSKKSSSILICDGQLRPGEYKLPGNVSSQYISGLYMALPLIDGDSSLCITEPIESQDYITLTLDVAKQFGWTPRNFNGYTSPGTVICEGDWSNACFWLCAGALPGGDITMTGLNASSIQGDKEVLDILERIGANVEWTDEVTVRVWEGQRNATQIDAAPIPDAIPILAAVAAVANGTTTVINAARLRIKESDRLTATADVLNALGANIQEQPEGLIIRGVKALTGGTEVRSHNDHRIAMMPAIAAAACDQPVTITTAEAVNKSYPAFWDDYAALQRTHA